MWRWREGTPSPSAGSLLRVGRRIATWPPVAARFAARMRPRPLPLVAVATAVAGAAVALWLFSPVPSAAQEDLGSLRSRADQQRAREQALSGDVARLGALV